MSKASKVSRVVCECCVMSCKEVGMADKMVDLRLLGWKGIKISVHWEDRTHTGWCPSCAKKFRVEEE